MLQKCRFLFRDDVLYSAENETSKSPKSPRREEREMEGEGGAEEEEEEEVDAVFIRRRRPFEGRRAAEGLRDGMWTRKQCMRQEQGCGPGGVQI